MLFVFVLLNVVKLVHMSPKVIHLGAVLHKKTYSPNQSMNCATENVIYLISCKRCEVQYAVETGQKLRNTFNNHRNRLRQLSNLYLNQHFTSDGHSEEDNQLKKVTCASNISIRAKRLEREDYWCRELCTVYPYGLNDNVW